ncbi:NAD(P)-dependent dehydrogenase (short-subunit alcohol dehydrogenase family) [Plasticicumulans lactativorans]|uniref:NAD(P)-dependent dehydrogenase (Short-subunit alcohol dehydrogenase family) n=1 Tax=Plasticicumulans lactativorans TaxID=1133106 RepID=A0A4R2L320_9GAMM|nr:SDR family oxidoreductase [Plasticicumulans lactativorans]TCO79627.1 NAD(P)-dependent dehydrogenase (short-subunit alcohol dehydrogenase family) [Plasticicumulans lactativorans]
MSTAATYPSLRDRVVFITGGATGIGADLVAGFARQGAKVAFIDVDAEGAAALLDGLGEVAHRPLFQRCDVTDIAALRAGIEAAAAHFGDIGVLINNVANDQRRALAEVEPAFFDAMVAVNLRPHLFAIQAVREGMRRLGGGAVVNVGSISWMTKNEGYPVYATLKSAAAGLTRSLARELGRDRIRINHLAPGWVMTEKQVRLWLDADGERAIVENQCLPDRLAPADITAMALFLAADDSRMVTAQDVVVDGGWS